MPGEAICSDARLRYWEEEWLSQLLAEALRLKGLTHEDQDSTPDGTMNA